MPDDGLSAFEQIYNNLLKSGTNALRDMNTREQTRAALVGAIRSILDKATKGRPDADLYKDEFSKEFAKGLVESEPFEQAFRSAQEVLAAVASYLEERLMIPVRMRSAVDPVSGKKIPPEQLAVIQGVVTSSAVVARSLDEKLRTKVEQKLSFSPSIVLDSTVHYVRKVDAAYNVTITSYDATVRMSTGFTVERPLTSSASVEGRVGVEINSGARFSGYLRGSTKLDDLYGKPQITGSQVGAGVALTLAPNATLNLDYTAKNILGPQRNPEQSIYLGIKIRF